MLQFQDPAYIHSDSLHSVIAPGESQWSESGRAEPIPCGEAQVHPQQGLGTFTGEYLRFSRAGIKGTNLLSA